MEYVGIALRTTLSIVSFPAFDNLLADKLTAFCRILSTIEVNKSLFLLPKCFGRPRYLPKPPSFVILNTDLAFSLIAGGVLLEKVIDDLFLLILYPELFP